MVYFFKENILYHSTFPNFQNKQNIFKCSYLRKKILYLKILLNDLKNYQESIVTKNLLQKPLLKVLFFIVYGTKEDYHFCKETFTYSFSSFFF